MPLGTEAKLLIIENFKRAILIKNNGRNIADFASALKMKGEVRSAQIDTIEKVLNMKLGYKQSGLPYGLCDHRHIAGMYTTLGNIFVGGGYFLGFKTPEEQAWVRRALVDDTVTVE